MRNDIYACVELTSEGMSVGKTDGLDDGRRDGCWDNQ